MTSEPDFTQYRTLVEQALEHYLPCSQAPPTRLHQAMRYSVLAGGKKLRPILAMATCEALGGAPETALPAACALELIHAYSLVHDDLPAMDDDALRRGRASCHVAFDEATAILCGDALQALAFEIVANAPDLSDKQRLDMVLELARASGHAGMVGGQATDLSAVGRKLDLPQLESMHRHKTGALIEAATVLGAIAADAGDGSVRTAVRGYAAALGLAFQVQDDILDVEGDTGTLGKQKGADADRGKPTYPSLLGLDAARDHLRALHREACDALSALPGDSRALRYLADFVIKRDH